MAVFTSLKHKTEDYTLVSASIFGSFYDIWMSSADMMESALAVLPFYLGLPVTAHILPMQVGDSTAERVAPTSPECVGGCPSG